MTGFGKRHGFSFFLVVFNYAGMGICRLVERTGTCVFQRGVSGGVFSLLCFALVRLDGWVLSRGEETHLMVLGYAGRPMCAL